MKVVRSLITSVMPLALLICTAPARADQHVAYSQLAATIGEPSVTLSTLDPATGTWEIAHPPASVVGTLGGVGDAIDISFPDSTPVVLNYQGSDTFMKVSVPIRLTPTREPLVMVVPTIIVRADAPARVEGSLTAWKGDEVLYWGNISFNASASTGYVPVKLLGQPAQIDRLELALGVRQSAAAGASSVSLDVWGMQFSTPPIGLPEPSNGAMALLGLVALGCLGRGRRSAPAGH